MNAAPSLNGLLNPFFLREVRQHRRGLLMQQFWWLACILLLAAVLAFGLWIGSERSRGGSPVLVLLCLAHTALCAAAAGYGGDRLFAAEQRSGTLMGVLMLPLPPARWLALKLAFPAWGILTTWLVGFPFYLFAVLYGGGSTAEALRAASFPPLFALGALAILLLLPPDFRERMQKLRAAAGTRSGIRDPDLTVRLLLAWSLGYALFAGSIRVFLPPARSVPFYLWSMPEWAFWAVLALAWVSAAWFSALASLLVTEEAERRGIRVRSVAGILVLVVVLGALWRIMHPWLRIGILAYTVIVIIAVRKRQQRQEDAASLEEIAWLQARRDDPQFIRDLRILTRPFSLRKNLVIGGAMLAIMAMVPPIAIESLTRGVFTWAFHPAGWMIDAYVGLVVALVANARSAMFWTRDRTAQTMPLLLMSPLTSRQILRGRIDAGLLHHVTPLVPLLLLAFGGGLWVLIQGNGLPLLVMSALATISVMQAVIYGSAWRPVRLAPGKIMRGDWELIVWWTLYGLLLAVMVVALIIGCVLYFAGAGSVNGTNHLIIALVEVVVGAGAGWSCWKGYRVRLRQLDAVRAGDLPMPD